MLASHYFNPERLILYIMKLPVVYMYFGMTYPLLDIFYNKSIATDTKIMNDNFFNPVTTQMLHVWFFKRLESFALSTSSGGVGCK